MSHIVTTSARQNRQRPHRKGATAVEFGIIAPILFLFIFAAIEFSRANMVLHSCRIAAIEGARRGVIPGANAQECRDVAMESLDIVGITSAQIEVDPSPILPSTATVSVRVRAPVNFENGFAIPNFLIGRTIESSVNLQRETATTAATSTAEL